MSLASGALGRPVTTVAATLAFVLVGAVSLGQLPVSLLPDVSLPVLTIRTGYPGAAATEVYRFIAEPIEEGGAARQRAEQPPRARRPPHAPDQRPGRAPDRRVRPDRLRRPPERGPHRDRRPRPPDGAAGRRGERRRGGRPQGGDPGGGEPGEGPRRPAAPS